MKVWKKYWKWAVWALVIFSFGYGVTGLIILRPIAKAEPQYTPTSESTGAEPTGGANDAGTSLSVKPMTVTNLFGFTDSAKIFEKKPQTTTLLVTGDVLLARTVNAKMVEVKDFQYPFALTKNELASSDITFVNLETPLTDDCKVKTDGMVFCGVSNGVEGLTASGIDVANFANNHAGNQGGEGVIATINTLHRAGIAVSGVGELVTIEKNGKTFGFLGFDDIQPRTSGIAWADIEDVRSQVINARSKVDFVIVQFHWGVEYTSEPTAQQKLLAHTAIDAGADLVVGNHPHWVQGVEMYKDKFIAYSHGNFIFDQQWSQPTTEGVVGKYTFDDKKLIGVEFFPVIMDKTLQTRWANEKEAAPILKRMKDAS